MKDLLKIADLNSESLQEIISLAQRYKSEPDIDKPLHKKVVVELYAKPSTRTRISFAAAIARLGGNCEVVSGNDLQLGRGETIEDTAQVISRYAAAFVIRTFEQKDVERFARSATIPVINALTDLHHPCQALADLLTIKERFGSTTDLKVAYIGDGNNVANSLIEVCALSGIEIAVATPKNYEPNNEIVKAAGKLVRLYRDPEEAVNQANVVYTDVWASMGVSKEESTKREEIFEPYQVNEPMMKLASPDAVFMHCLPAHRNLEVAPEVIDGSQSIVFEQAENRMHTAQAVLSYLVN